MRKYTATANGKRYEMTVAVATAPNGKAGVRITCSCGTHGPNGAAAIVATPSGLAFPKANIHGHVTMAHSPIGALAAKQGKVWKS